jgi:hypothetical protein
MTVSTTANTTQQHAYEYVSDLSHHPEWAMDQMTIEPVMPGPVSVGSKFKLHYLIFPMVRGSVYSRLQGAQARLKEKLEQSRGS